MSIITFISIIIILIYIKYLFIVKKIKHHDFKPDIIISPCGFYGIYSLGVCAYIKNKFNLYDKKIAGLSSGSFNAIYLCLHKKHNKKFLKKVFMLNNRKNKNIKVYAKSIINEIEKTFHLDDIELKQLYVGVSHPNNLRFYNNFNTMSNLLQCCMGSSFIPGITHHKLIYLYENKYTIDGAFWYKYYKKHINTDEILIISPRMFGRYKKNLIFDSVLNKNIPLYQLFLNGYHDAKKNHNYFKKYLNEI